MSDYAEPAYAELGGATSFSFLHGASSPADMVNTAVALGMSGIGIADRNTVAGVVRAWMALRDLRASHAAPEHFRLITGARLVFADGTPDILAFPKTRHGWGRLTSLLTRGNLRAVKGDCILHLPDLLAHLDDIQLIVLPPERFPTALPSSPPSHATPQEAHRAPVDYTPALALPALGLAAGGRLEDLLAHLSARAPQSVWLGAAMHRRGDDERRLARLSAIARAAQVPLIAVNDALFARATDKPLQDVMTAIRLGTTVMAAGRELAAHAERHLKPPAEMARLFLNAPEAIAQTQRFLAGIAFTLDELRYNYPGEPVPQGWRATSWLLHLVKEAAIKRYGGTIPTKVRRLIAEEIRLIRTNDCAPYFLTVHDIVRYARSQGILCQGRGSAANSVVCFLLGVTSVDPMQHDLLFSRFMSPERKEPPDIDVDFEHERREEVMQYIYRRYGRHRAAIAATVIHYRPKSAVREVGRALGLSEDVTQRLSSTVWGSWGKRYGAERIEEAGFDPENPQVARLGDLVAQIMGLPRHLSQHVGGFVLTQDRLDEIVPIHHGGMEGRSFIEWDKDDIDALDIMKVDILALGMLTAIAKGFVMMRGHGLGQHSLEIDLGADDPAVYDMLCQADSVGVFQVESRAQMNMLPRLKPREFYDLVVQVAIVRPGPIEGDMVHPYLRRRSGEEKVDFPSPKPPHDAQELRGVLGKTFGVPIFQEQAMRLAITAAAFTSAQANGLRRAMATFRNLGKMAEWGDKMIGGMVARGYEQEFAARCFRQIEGFGSYGFPESHAQSFARLVYVSAWMKCHYPAVFCACLLNAQPMGFYAPAQLVRDAREHGVEVRGMDVNFSRWDSTLEAAAQDRRAHRDAGLALRLGLRQITGLREEWARAIERAAPFTTMEDLARRANLPPRALRLLADADACASLGMDRRQALWEARRTPTDELPLFAAAKAAEVGREEEVRLPSLTMGEQVAADYQMTRLSLKAHPMALMRPLFAQDNVTPCEALHDIKSGRRVRVAGVVLVRQRPGKGNAIFITLEDEGGVANIILWASQFEAMRRPVMTARVMVVEGELERSKEGVTHIVARNIIDRSEVLGQLSELDTARPTLSRADVFEHPQPPRYPGMTASAVGHGMTASAVGHGMTAPAVASGMQSPPPERARHPRNARLLPRSRDFH